MIFAFSPAPRRETRIRGLFSHVRECLPLFRTGAKGVAAFMPRGSSAKRCTNATPIFFPEKENGRRPSKRKAFTLAVSISKSCTRCALHSRWQLCCLTDVAYPLRVIGCGVHGFAMNPYVSLPVSTAPYYCEARVTFARRQTTCGTRHCCACRIDGCVGRRGDYCVLLAASASNAAFRRQMQVCTNPK